MWFINGTEDDSERNQNHEDKSAKIKRNVLFLGLEPKIFFSLVTILTSKAEARNVNPYGAPLAAYYVSILSTEEGKGSHCTSLPTEMRKKISLVFKLSEDTDNSGRVKTQRCIKMPLELNVRFLKSRKSRDSRNVRTFSNKRSLNCIVCVLEKKTLFASFCYFFSTFVPGRPFLHYYKNIKVSHFLQIDYLFF